jgi:ankyrin repeat protein
MADVNVHDIFEDPAAAELAEAIAARDDARVRALAPAVDLSTRGDEQVTLLEWALLNKNAAALQLLLDAGADPAQPGLDDDTVVHLAAQDDDPAYLRLLLAHGASPDVAASGNGATPLSAALMADRIEQFRMLLAAGADPGHADRAGNTPLHVAGKINRPGRAIDLLRAGADAAARNAQDATFEDYLVMTDPELFDDRARADLDALIDWLREHPTPAPRG